MDKCRSKNSRIANNRTPKQKRIRLQCLDKARVICNILNTKLIDEQLQGYLYKELQILDNIMEYISTCDYCSKYYTLNRANRKFCSNSCRVRFCSSSTS